VADLIASNAACEAAVTRKTHKDQDRAWGRWITYTESIGLGHDPFLDDFTRPQRIRLMGAFAMAYREGRFSGPAHETLAEGTIRGAISYVASTFRDNDRTNPTLDYDGKLGRLLSRQFRAFRNKDPPLKQQKALPSIVLDELAKLQVTETQKATAQLAVGAFFYACRSCEYLKVSSAEERRTDILRIRCIRFFTEGRVMNNKTENLQEADCCSITFEMQKKDEKMDTVTQLTSGDSWLCPVKSWAIIVKRILSYPGANEDTPVSACWRNGKLDHLTAEEMVRALEAAVSSIGYDKLNLKPGDIGTHSIRSGAAMAMVLGDVPVYTIMMLGRWSSDAFLRYIRKQVEQFSHNVSKRMILHRSFRHIPEIDPRISPHDPRQRNHPNNAETRRNIGGDGARAARLPAFALYR